MDSWLGRGDRRQPYREPTARVLLLNFRNNIGTVFIFPADGTLRVVPATGADGRRGNKANHQAMVAETGNGVD
ncbi:MAG: hypothetical protein HC890_03105 [Chloroflexaceae bacterium]|nr:hypothetical protein [Chloroflexaceae bacterium]